MKKGIRHLVVILLVSFGSSMVAGGEKADDWKSLAEPCTHMLMRDAKTPRTGDSASFEIGICETQRNLSEAGRDHHGRRPQYQRSG